MMISRQWKEQNQVVIKYDIEMHTLKYIVAIYVALNHGH